ICGTNLSQLVDHFQGATPPRTVTNSVSLAELKELLRQILPGGSNRAATERMLARADVSAAEFETVVRDETLTWHENDG
ncbi:MAG: hypothetical protein AAFN76_04255, partial [Pseudomonadota bacterium]